MVTHAFRCTEAGLGWIANESTGRLGALGRSLAPSLWPLQGGDLCSSAEVPGRAAAGWNGIGQRFSSDSVRALLLWIWTLYFSGMPENPKGLVVSLSSRFVEAAFVRQLSPAWPRPAEATATALLAVSSVASLTASRAEPPLPAVQAGWTVHLEGSL